MKTHYAILATIFLALLCARSHAGELEATLISIEGDEKPVKILELTLEGLRIIWERNAAARAKSPESAPKAGSKVAPKQAQSKPKNGSVPASSTTRSAR